MNSCPPFERLAESLSRAEPEEEIRAHLESCSGCRARAEEICADLALIDELGTVSAGFTPDVAAPAPDVRPGEIADYEILSEIHRGGQGVVYSARRRSDGRTVALKTLLRGEAATARERLRFEREIAIASGLHHPHIVRLLDSGTTQGGTMYLVMELIEGEDLESHLRRLADRRPGPSLPFLWQLFLRIGEAVAFAHGRGIVHRDLKPRNILIDAVGEPHILDFGLAKSLERTFGAEAPALTRTGQFVGTLAWAAPEQIRGGTESLDQRTDVYALGLLLYRMLTGRHAYDLSGSVARITRTILYTDPVPPGRLCGDLDRRGDAVVLSALEKRPRDRYPSAGEFAADVRRLLEGSPVRARHQSGFHRLRRGVRRHPLASFLLAILVVGVVWIGIERESQRKVLAREFGASLVEQGRLESARGRVVQAEHLLWSQHLDPPTGTPVEEAGPWRSYWALWELYALHPCEATVATSFHGGNRPFLETADGAIVLGDPATGRIEVRSPAGLEVIARTDAPGGVVTNLSVASTGRQLAVCGTDGALALWDRRGNDGTWRRPDLPACDVVIHDGEHLLLGTKDGRLLRWDPAGDRSLGEVRCFEGGGFRLLRVSPDGQTIVAQGADGHALLLDAALTIRGEESTALAATLSDARFCGESKHLVGGRRMAMDVVEIENHHAKLLRRLPSDLSQNICCDSSPRECLAAASGGPADRIVLWDCATGERKGTLGGHGGDVRGVRFSATGSHLVGIDEVGILKIWDLRGLVTPLPPGPTKAVRDRTVHNVSFRLDGEAVAWGGGPETGVRVQVRESGKTFADSHGGSIVTRVAFCPDRPDWILSSSHDGGVRLWEFGSATEPRVLYEHEDKASYLAVHPDGRWVASSGNRGTIVIWDMRREEVHRRFTADPPLRSSSLVWGADGDLLAAGRDDGRVLWYENHTGTYRLTTEAHSYAVRCLALSPDGGLLVTGSSDRTLKIWRPGASRAVRTLSGHEADVYAVAFDPSGRVIVSADRIGELRFWDAEDGEELASLHAVDRAVFSLAFDPDGTRIALGGEEELIAVLDLAAVAKRIAGNFDHQRARLEGDPDASALEAMVDWVRSLGPPTGE